MIKTKLGETRISGNIHEVMADLSLIIHNLYHDALPESMTKEEAKERIMHAVKIAFMEENEVRESARKTLKDIMEILGM